jgi:nucleotide-binding universal stress UspA family protein
MTAPRHILVPVDFSRCSRAALSYALQRAHGLPCVIDVLYVARPFQANVTVHLPEHTQVPLSEYARGSAVRDLDHFVVSMRSSAGTRLRPRVEFGDAAEVILRIAAEEGYDQVIMGAHSQNARTEVRLGAVADRVAHAARCPVVTVSGDVISPIGERAAKPAPNPKPRLLPTFEQLAVKWIG